QAPSDWLIIANGFSCREQISQGSSRRALHLAEVLQMALNDGGAGTHPHPESAITRDHEAEVVRSMKRAGIGLAALATGGALLWKLCRSR
ncbi:MAG: hypothetical protein WCC37_00195, partial [Candidatus Sulfotelmatobacter sp.]